jgi:hypothetical protein
MSSPDPNPRANPKGEKRTRHGCMHRFPSVLHQFVAPSAAPLIDCHTTKSAMPYKNSKVIILDNVDLHSFEWGKIASTNLLTGSKGKFISAAGVPFAFFA